MPNFAKPVSALLLAALLGACSHSYSPDTYASNAAQQAANVVRGVVIGVREVKVSAAGTVGTATGAAAGGVAGAQVGTGATTAFSAIGGTLLGGLVGAGVEHSTADTSAYEYIVRKTTADPKTNGTLVSVTQQDTPPLGLGQRVLVIAGPQARIVPDYTDPTLDAPPLPRQEAPAPVHEAPLPAAPPPTAPDSHGTVPSAAPALPPTDSL